MSESARRVLQNSLVRVGGYGLGSVLYLAIIALVGRHLGREGFGHFAFILAVVGSVQLAVDMGVRSILIRDIAVARTHLVERLAAGRTLLWMLSALALGVVAVVGGVMATTVEVRQAAYLAAVASVVTLYALGYSAVLRAFEEMEWDILGFVLHKVVYLGLVLAVIAGRGGLRAVFAAMLSANLVLYIYYRVVVRARRGRIPMRFDLRGALRLLGESFPLGIAEALRRFTWQVDKLLLGVLVTPVAVGLFSAAYKLVEAINPFTANLTLPLFPAFARFGADSPARLLAAYERSLKFLYTLGVPLAVGLFVFSDPIVELLFGREYVEAALVLKILAPAVVLLFPISAYGYVFTALGRQRSYTACVGTALAVKVALDLVLIPRYSYTGAAVATLVGEVTLYLAGYALLRRLGQLASIGPLWRPLLAGLGMGAVCWLVRETSLASLAVGVVSACASYGAIVVALGTFTHEERALLLDAVRVRLGGG